MKEFFVPFFKAFFVPLFLLFSLFGFAQSPPPLSLKDFAIWGGSADASIFNNDQGVFLRNTSIINGNIGSNHFVHIKNGVALAGSIYSGNGITVGVGGLITGNLYAYKQASNFNDTAIFGSVKTRFTGNIISNGLVVIKSVKGPNLSFVNGKVSVPAPSAAYYKGPVPTAGINNNLVFPALPTMPDLTPFDNLTGTLNITTTRVLSPGVYRNIELKGNQTITLDGPGNYIFDEIYNLGKNNNLVFDFKNTTTGDINIYIKNEAQWGNITVKAINGVFESRIFTEVHGNGTKRRPEMDGVAFEMKAPGMYPEGSYLWLGNVWAPNGAILIKGTKKSDRPHVRGALWSTVRVDIKEIITLFYSAPSPSSVSYIAPYYAPPPSGKEIDPDNIIGAELTSLSNNPGPITAIPENKIFRFNDQGNVMIEVISKSPSDNALLQELIDLGMTDIVDNGPHIYVITGFFPINQLKLLNVNPRIEYVHPWYPPVNNSGQITTKGDITMRSDLVRQRFGLDGSGIKIGVISDSYNAKSSAQDDVDQGDLPGIKSTGQANDNPEEVQVLQGLQQRGNDEGRAMLQIVHDIAPKAKLAFRTGFLSAGDFAKGILELADPNLEGGKCDIIVDDLSYITEPFFKDGVVAQVVDQVVGQGVTYFTSAGNFGKRSYESNFRGVDNTAVIPAPAQVHQFGTNATDIYQSILLKPGTYTIVLQWDEAFHSLGEGGVQTDLDLYLVGANGFTLFGFNRSNLFKDPFEVCPFVVKEETTAKLMVVRASGNSDVRFKYIIFRGDGTILDYPEGTSTIVGHANARGAISVGAMFYENKPGVTTNWPGVASFSSRGGTFIRENDEFITRNKPDIIAPNGVNTTVNLGGELFNDGDTYPNFFGTSAAAPHAAGVGALLIQARKKFNLQETVTPEEIRQQLIDRAGKFSYLPGNFSFEGGYGFLQADSSLTTMANAKPIIDTMMALVPGSQNGTDSFAVKIIGKYLTPGTRIYKNGVPLRNIDEDSPFEAIAMAPPIAPGEDPAFQLFNGAKSPSGLDGGLSEPYFFFSERKTVTINAENKNRKYGQNNPELTADIRINNIPVEETGNSLTDLKLDAANLLLNTIATPTSKPGNYGIFPDLITPLAPDDPLLTQYRFIFTSGTLNVGKLPLRITADDQTIKYGEYPDEIKYLYEINLDGYWDLAPEEYIPEIKRLHEEYMAKNSVIVVKGLNIEEDETFDEDDLINMSTLASFQSVLRAKKYVLENGQLKAMVNVIAPSDIGNQRFLIETPVNALVNYLNEPTSTTLGYASEQDLIHTGLLNLKALSKGEASAAMPNGQLKAMVNGQLMGMVNGQLETTVDAGYYATVNGNFINVNDIIFQNGQLRALINGEEWVPVTNGQLRAIVNGGYAEFELSVVNGQLRAIVNGSEMTLSNGQLRAIVNGQDVSIANGQLRAMVNSQLVPLVNNELMGIANGQLRAMVNGEMTALVNSQLLALIDSELEEITELTLINGQLRAMVNGQLRALINGQLKAMINGDLSNIDNNDLSMVNGQLRAMVNGQLRAMVNGQLRAIVNGQLRAMVNSEAISIEKVIQLANGQLKALINGHFIPIRNGQLRAMINGQLRAMVNGELMAEEDGQINFTVFENGQLKAMVNGQLRAIVNGQLRAMVNGQMEPVDSYVIENGQLKAMVNGEEWVYPNGQLKALVNGQLKALVNNFDVSGTNNNANTMVLVGEDDLLKQQGDIGGMFSMAMITGINAGNHRIIPAAFINENYEVSYEAGYLDILQAPVTITTGNATKVYGEENPAFSGWSVSDLAFDETVNFEDEEPYCDATAESNVGLYPIEFYPSISDNYYRIEDFGNLSITPKLLTVTADNKTAFQIPDETLPNFTISYNGLVGDDTPDSVCVNFITPASPKVINDYDRTVTYSNVLINGVSNVFFATPDQNLNLSGTFISYRNPTMDCEGCVTQLHIGMGDGVGNFFTNCYEATNDGSTGNLNAYFNAPTTPGVYYITQRGSWWYYCDQFTIDNHKVADINKFAIAVVIVTPTGTPSLDKISAILEPGEDLSSEPGDYSIYLMGCPVYNPNYTVVLVNGTLSLFPDPGTEGLACDGLNLYTIHWKGNGSYINNNEEYGTPVGGVTANGEGQVGSASFSFNGTGYIDVGTVGSASGQGDFSVSAWVKTTSSDPMVIINQRDEGIWGEYILKIGGGDNVHSFDPVHYGQVYFMMYEPDNNPDVLSVYSNTRVNDGNWHHVRGTRIGTTMSIYVDGILESTVITPGSVDLNSALKTFIGADYRDNASYFNGLIDDIRVEFCNPGTGGGAEILTEEAVVVPKAKKEIITKDLVYPNPATNTIRLQLTEDVININEIQVLSAFGKMNRTNTRKIDDGVYELNITGLPKGVYFLKARTAGGIKTFKFIKM